MLTFELNYKDLQELPLEEWERLAASYDPVYYLVDNTDSLSSPTTGLETGYFTLELELNLEGKSTRCGTW